MQIIDNRLLLFRTRTPSKYAMIPRHKVVAQPAPGVYEVAVHWGIDEARVLRNLGVKDVPSPIQGRYNWPGRYKPFEHQIATASFLTMNNRAYCFNEAGTGKSLSCLWAADYLMKVGAVRRCLIVCPLSIMEAAWMRDLMNGIIHRTAVVAHSSSMDRRKELIAENTDFVIINYDGVLGVAEEINADGEFDLIICDEANFIKNASTRRWKSINAITKPDTRVWALTGTPTPQSPMDAYGLAKLVTPASVPRFSTAWRDQVMMKVTQFKFLPKKEAPALVHAALQPAIRFTKAMCLDLPPVLTSVRQAKMTAQQQKYYDIVKRQAAFEVAGETVTAVHAASVLTKLLQISAGAVYTDDKETVVFDCSHRFSALDEILEDTDRKVLVFAAYRHSIETITEHLQKNNISCKAISGDVSAANRAEIFNDFQNKENPRVLVIQPQAAAHGVTLTAADTVVFWGPVMSVETYIQCIARADRIGQVGASVTVHHIQSSPIEEQMFKQLEGRINNHMSITKLYDDEMKGL